MLAKASSNVRSLEDLRGKAVVVTEGTTREKMRKSQNDERTMQVRIVASPDRGESFRAVDEGSAIAFPMDDVLPDGLVSGARIPGDFALAGKHPWVAPYAIMLRKGDPAFGRVVNRAPIERFQSGEIRRIHATWFATRGLAVPTGALPKEAFAAPNASPA